MRPHKVISAFTAGGEVISPPGPWTPPDQGTADRLLKARCLKAPKASVNDADGEQAPATEQRPKAAPKVTEKAKTSRKTRGGKKK